MSEEQLKAFLEAVKADAVLQEKLNASVDADAVVAIAKEAGFVISAEELQRAQEEVSEDLRSTSWLISEQELEGVAGGMGVVPGGYACSYANGLCAQKPPEE
jgi:predicted ribosomally synthesized peptide with nif11-like leader